MEFNFQITPGAKALYQNGVDFLRAAERCLGMDDNGKVTIVDNGVFRTLAAPAVVNAAFACEMFLKDPPVNARIKVFDIVPIISFPTFIPD